MAQQCPKLTDVPEIQFKLRYECQLFDGGNQWHGHENLVAVASSRGIIFAGNPLKAELKVAISKDLVDCKGAGRKLSVRTVQLSHIPKSLSCSADGNLLAISYVDDTAFLQIFDVSSFVQPNIISVCNMRLSPEVGVTARQLLWNPVLTNNIAVVLSNGALCMYTIKEGGHFEMHSLDKSKQVQSGSWSPKGKQIVLGFPNGVLQQFKPDLTPAKCIPCPANIHPGPFDTIALHWLSTFQFAVVFLQHGEDGALSLYIVNAPKNGTPAYINYGDVCYSSGVSRTHQFTFFHIAQWNLMIVISANSTEVAIMGVKEGGSAELPLWSRFMLSDDARIEMPLLNNVDETFPIGFGLDTSSSHQLTVNDEILPIMPMVHVLSTHGFLISFDFLNLTLNTVGICSPPPPISDVSGLFLSLEEKTNQPKQQQIQQTTVVPTQVTSASANDLTFTITPNTVTSTPAVKDKHVSLFGSLASGITSNANTMVPNSGVISQTSNTAPQTNIKQTTSFFGGSANVQSTPAKSFPGMGNVSGGPTASFGAFKANSQENSQLVANVAVKQPNPEQTSFSASQNTRRNDLQKPLYTIPPNYVSNTNSSHTQQPTPAQTKSSTAEETKTHIDSSEQDEIIKQIMAVQINCFNFELQEFKTLSKTIVNNIGKPDELKNFTKRLNDLHEIIDQANDPDFETDIQNLRHSLNESYVTLAECRSKMEFYKNPDLPRLSNVPTFEPANTRQIAKLRNYLATNQVQLKQLQHLIDAQWSSYQDMVRRNTKSQLHIPCLDGIYQRMTKLKDGIARQRIKLNYIRSKMKQQGFILNETDTLNSSARPETLVESITDSMISMNLSQIVDETRSKLTPEKLAGIRNFTKQQKEIATIKPQRPDRVGLKSEVILETKLQREKKAREGATTNITKMQQEKLKENNVPNTVPPLESTYLAKPTATKPLQFAVQPQPFSSGAVNANISDSNTSIKSSMQPPMPPPVKPQVVVPKSTASFGLPKPEQSVFKPFASTGLFSGFNSNAPPMGFNSPKPPTSIPPTTIKSAVSTEHAKETFVAPITFSAKVVGSKANSTEIIPNVSITSMPNKSATNNKENQKPIDDSAKTFSAAGNAAGVEKSTAEPSIFANTAEAVVPKALSFSDKLNLAANNTQFSFGNVTSNAAQSNTAAPLSFAIPKPVLSSTESANIKTNSAITTSTPSTVLGFGSNASNETKQSSATTTTSATSVASSNSSLASLSNLTAQLPAMIVTTTSVESKRIDVLTGTVASEPKESAKLLPETDSADKLLASVNICKPQTKADDGPKTPTNTNIFSGFSTNTPKSSTTSSFSFTQEVANLSGNASSTTPTSSKTAATVPTTTKPIASPSTSFSFSLAGLDESTAAPTNTTGNTQPLSVTSAAPTSVFGSTTSFFGTPTSSTTPASIFSSAAASTVAANTTTSGSLFATTTAPASSGSIFGGIPKPEQPAGAAATTGLFAAAAAANPLPFGAANPASGTSIFGSSNSSSFSSGTSLFGGTAATTTTTPFGAAASTGGSIFGGTAKTAETTNVFGAAVSGSPSTGSIFRQSAFAQPAAQSASGGNLFGAATNQQATAATGFGNSGSIFGGTAAVSNTGGSIFGGSPTTSSTSVFGGSSNTFGSTFAQTGTSSVFGGNNTAASGPFAQAAGGSVSQTGFGSPQQAAGLANPVFGGAPSFGSPPSFGAQPSFGGAATFGSPQRFGFGSTNPASPSTGAFTSPTQKSNLFEALGSSDTGLSFGNLAQTTNTNASKPTFGGTSFMNYRA